MTGINDLQTVFSSASKAGESRAAGPVENKPSAAAAKGYNSSPVNDDQTVSVSTAAGALAQVSGQDDVRHERVAALQAAIQSGTYNVSSSAVADKLIDSMLGGR